MESIIAEKPAEFRALLNQIYAISSEIAEPQLTETLAGGSLGAQQEQIEHQKIVTVRNRWTGEMAIINSLRAGRPMQTCELPPSEFSSMADCAFCRPHENTPVDRVAGTIETTNSITRANLYPFAAKHAVVISKSHDPLKITREQLEDQLLSAREWGKVQYAADNTLAIVYIMGNIGPRAASSIEHGHMQVIMVRGGHLPHPEQLKWAGDNYSQWGSNGKSLFNDMFTIHEGLGLGVEFDENKIMAELTPVKDKGIMAFRHVRKWEDFVGLLDAAYAAIRAYREMCVTDFNFAFILPPIPRDYGWDRFPAIFRIFDRGSRNQKPADFGSMETIGGAAVVGVDPFMVMPYLTKALSAPQP